MHVVCSNITAHSDEHKLLSDVQHAVRKRHSCGTHFNRVMHNLAIILDIKTLKSIYAFICYRQRVVVIGVHSYSARVVPGSQRAPFLAPCCSSFQINDVSTDIDSKIMMQLTKNGLIKSDLIHPRGYC